MKRNRGGDVKPLSMRHGRARPGHPRLWPRHDGKDANARHEPGMTW